LNSTVKTISVWLLIIAVAITVWYVARNGNMGNKEQEKSFSEFMNEVNQGNVADVTILGQDIRGKLKPSANETNLAFHTTAPEQFPDMYKTLTEKNVAVTVKNTQPGAWSGVLFYVIVPLLLIGGMWFFMIRQMQTGGNKALSFGKSRAHLVPELCGRARLVRNRRHRHGDPAVRAGNTLQWVERRRGGALAIEGAAFRISHPHRQQDGRTARGQLLGRGDEGDNRYPRASDRRGGTMRCGDRKERRGATRRGALRERASEKCDPKQRDDAAPDPDSTHGLSIGATPESLRIRSRATVPRSLPCSAC
jgi:hypothetical protein